MATQQDHTFVAGASQALADWTAKYQHAMSQGENQSMHDQLARWDRVREAGIALSRHITSLTTEHGQSTVSGEIFWTLILACFQRVRVRTEATFSEVNATLPSLLCRFVTPDQAGKIMASIFTCLCNYNTKICGLAMAQTIVPVYTIPNTYRVQQSLWESLCQIIPGITRTSGSELCSFKPVAPRNTPVGQSDTAPGTGSSGDPGTGIVGLGNLQNVAVSLPTCKKDVTQETRLASLLDGIPLVGSKWALLKQHIPTVNFADDGDPPDANPQETSTPIKATLVSERRLSKKKLNVSKIKVSHLLFDMQDRQEKAWRSVELEDQATVPDRTSGKGRGSSGELPHGLPATLPDRPGEDGMPTVPTDPTLEAPKQDNKRPHDDDDEIMEVPDEDKPAGPPRKKKKKKKGKDEPKDEVPIRKGEDDGARPSTLTVEPEDVADEATPVQASTEVPAEETKTPKKKKKKQKKEDAELEKFRLEQREAKAKEMSKVKHRKLQHEQDFRVPAVPDWTSGKGCGSGGELPHGLPATLPDRPGEDGMPTIPTDPTPEAPKRDNKCPHDDDDEITEVPDEDKPAGPPRKKKKKKKGKDDPKDEVPIRKGEDDGAHPSTLTVEPEDVADEATLVPASTEVPAEETKTPKKKKKKQKKEDAELEKFQLEQREAKAKEMSKVKHRKIQREQDFRALRNYRKSIPGALLETINGADHSSHLLERFQKENNYMSKKCSHKRNLMTVERLLTRIAKYADELTKRLKEAQQVIKSTFLMVQGMPSGDKCTPEFAVRVLMDCDGNLIDCDHQEYGKEQNIGLHDVVSPAAMARVMARETYIVDEIPITIKADNAYCPFCAYTASNHRAINNHVRMHLRAIMVCGWPGCYFVHMQSKRMIEHSAEAHGMAWAKPAREKGGD